MNISEIDPYSLNPFNETVSPFCFNWCKDKISQAVTYVSYDYMKLIGIAALLVSLRLMYKSVRAFLPFRHQIIIDRFVKNIDYPIIILLIAFIYFNF